MARRKKNVEPAPETIAPTAGPGDVPWLSEQISSVGTWHRKTAANVKQLSTALKTAKAEHKEASEQLSRLAVELANARGEYDPEEIEAEQQNRPLLKACGVHGEKSLEASQEAAAELPPIPAGDWRNDTLSDVLDPLGEPSADRVREAFAQRINLADGAYIDMNVVHVWFADRPRGDQVKIIDLDLEDALKVAFLETLASWRSARLQHAGAMYPEGFPIEYVTPEFHGLKEIVKKVKHRARAKASKAKKATAVSSALLVAVGILVSTAGCGRLGQSSTSLPTLEIAQLEGRKYTVNGSPVVLYGVTYPDAKGGGWRIPVGMQTTTPPTEFSHHVRTQGTIKAVPTPAFGYVYAQTTLNGSPCRLFGWWNEGRFDWDFDDQDVKEIKASPTTQSTAGRPL